MRFPKRTIFINNMEKLEEYLGAGVRGAKRLIFLELERNVHVPGVDALVEQIPAGFDRDRMEEFYQETGLNIRVEVLKDWDLTMYDRKGRYPREDAVIWNHYFMENVGEHPEWLEPQDEADILVRYIYPLETEEKGMENKKETEWMEKVEQLLAQEAPETFDFKRLMKEYYEKYQCNFRTKIGEDTYSEMMAAMPYARDGESGLVNYLKYKNADMRYLYSYEKKRYIVCLFDCDSSNDTCELSSDIYATLWGWNLKKKQMQVERFRVEGKTVLFSPDTMNTGATMLNEYVENEYDVSSCSVRKLYERIVLKAVDEISEWQARKSEGLEDVLEDVFGKFLCASGTLGNFTLVPYGFNVKRYRKVKDDWFLSLKLLEGNGEKEMNEDLTCEDNGYIIWDNSQFAQYVNMTYQWEFYQFIKDDERYKELMEKGQKEICEILTRLIIRRGVFMTAMLKIAKCEELPEKDDSNSDWNVSSFYKEIAREIFMNREIYGSYEEVLERIVKLAEDDGVSEYVGSIIDEAKDKLRCLKWLTD